MTVLIAGGGIAGLTLGLTLHQIGVPFRIYEATRTIRPLGVGINIQPNAVRELFDLGLAKDMDGIGIKTRQYGFYSKYGHTIWEEPRGLGAGYAWPQYSVHRGKLQMLLYETLIRRAGPDCIVTGQRATGFDSTRSRATLLLEDVETGGQHQVNGTLIIGADGIHSAIRARIVPDEGPPIWGGAILWRATSQAPPYFGGAAMALAGHNAQRVVAYPISEADPETGLVTMNWIAELQVDPSNGWNREDWNRVADIGEFLPQFESWTFDWLDVPSLIKSADQVYEYPMVDRDPVGQWTHGAVTLMGDAAHPTYPVGSTGATQAIIDARIIGAAVLEYGLTCNALREYEDQMRPLTTAVTTANRQSGPDAILQKVEDLCQGQFDDIDDVMPHKDLAAHAEHYKKLAGFSVEALNARPRLIARDAHFSR